MIRLNSLCFTIGALVLLPGATACDRSGTGSATGTTERQAESESVAGAPEALRSAAAPEAVAVTPVPPPGAFPAPEGPDLSGLDDAGLAAVMQSLQLRLTEEAQLAEGGARSREVRALAHDLEIAHAGALGAQESIFRQFALVPRVSAVSAQIDADAQRAIRALRRTLVPAFDDAYLDRQARVLGETVALFDRMRATTTNRALQAQLDQDRVRLEADVRSVARVQRDLKTGVTSLQPEAPRGTSPLPY